MNCYANTIHCVGMSPFVVIYISPDQIRLYNAYKKKNPYTRMTGDSSGGFAHKLERPGGMLSQHIFLYSFVISDEYQVSVSSAFTEKQDMGFIKYYMDEWLLLGGSIPNKFIADMSPALLGAAVHSFGRKSSMVDYINSLFNLLTGIDDQKPSCFVRIDIAHFIKSVTSCKPLKTARIKHKDFFVRSVALMLKMKNLSQARQHILEVLVVAMSSTEGYSSESGDATPSETSKQSIIRKIKGIKETDEQHTLIVDNINAPEPQILSEEEQIQNNSQEELLEYVDSVTSTFNDWIVDIENEAKMIVTSCDDGDRDNLMLNLPFAVFFRKICKLLLLWSAMCRAIFDSPYETSSSSNIECDFKNVKVSLGDLIPCRVDVFIQNHLEMLDGAVKIASKKYLKTIADNNSDKESGRSNNDEESVDSKHDDDDFLENNANAYDEVICVACANNDSPGDAHKCYKCGRNVHILHGFSLTIGQEEGYDEKRICISCSKKESGATLRQKKSPIQETKQSENTLRTTRRSRKSPRTKSIGQSKNTTSGTNSSVMPMTATNKSSRNQLKTSALPDGLSNGATGKSLRYYGSSMQQPKITTRGTDSSLKLKAGEKKSSSDQSKKDKENSIYTEFNHKEKWSKRKKVKRSVYIKPSPHWDLITNINKRVKLVVLTNGNFSKTVNHVNKVAVNVGNTCCFDSIAQVFAGAYAYFESFRETCEKSDDRIFEIAILLAKNCNLKKINNLRASLLHSIYERKSFEMVLTEMLNKLLENTPSYTEVSKCMSCKYSQKRTNSIVGVNSDVYCDNMSNLETGILANFPVDIMCKCKNILHMQREFGEHLFIELPSCNNYSASLFEESAVFRLKDVPLVLNLFNYKYVLFGLIIFQPPFLEHDIGHYTSAIRLNNKWEMFDDQISKSYTVLPYENVVIHCMLYIKCDVADGVQNDTAQPTLCNSLELESISNSQGDPIGKSTALQDESNLNERSLQDESILNENLEQNSAESFETSEHTFESFYRLYHQVSM